VAWCRCDHYFLASKFGKRSCFNQVNQLSQLEPLSQLKVIQRYDPDFIRRRSTNLGAKKGRPTPKKKTILGFITYRKMGQNVLSQVESGHVPSGRTTIVIFHLDGPRDGHSSDPRNHTLCLFPIQSSLSSLGCTLRKISERPTPAGADHPVVSDLKTPFAHCKSNNDCM
jgi:hypothetical protein